MKKRSIPLDQYLYHDIEDEEAADRYVHAALPLIGRVVVEFNGLEQLLDAALCQIISDRTDREGLIVLNNLQYGTKLELFKRFSDELLRITSKEIQGYDKLCADLRECGRLRNLVVHADWENTDPEGFTYVRLKISAKGMEQEYVQFSETSLSAIVALIRSSKEHLEMFWEKRQEAFSP
ncbi:MAG: hypothetical protein KF911_03490 [Pseudomonadales bacterium]|nr:hypothetical protein [Pseudomonadales bacterium]